MLRRVAVLAMGVAINGAVLIEPVWAGCFNSKCNYPSATISIPAANATYGSTQSIIVSGRATGDYVIDSVGEFHYFTISRVEVYNGATLVGNATLGATSYDDLDRESRDYSYTFAPLAGGAYTLKVKAYDSYGSAASNVTQVSITVVNSNVPPSVALTSPSSGAVLTANKPATLTATASDSDGSVTGVQYFDGSTAISGIVTASPYTFSWTPTTPNAHALKAVATDNSGASTTSASINVTVNDAPTATLTVSNVTNQNPGSITLQATASDAVGGLSAVQYLANGSVLSGAITGAPYTYNWAGVGPGTYSIVARATDVYGVATDSAPYVWVVNAAPSVSIAAPANGTVFSAPGSFTLTANAADSDGAVTSVQWYANGGAISGALTSAPYAFTWSGVSTGIYSITARATDNSGQSSTSAPVTVTVGLNPPPVAVAITPPNLAGGVAGTLAGAAAVAPSGAATYSIPLAMPPGTAGLVPALSLQYDSHAETTLLGRGWSLGGLSSITRCGKTLVQDGVRSAVTLTSQDAYCIDGQRLLLVSGTHGATAEYRTQVEGFSQVLSYGSDPAKGPDYWQVKARNGLIHTYGGTADATIEAQGKTSVLTWALSRVQDRRGNHYTLSYAENNAQGEYAPVQIRYTGNTASGLVPYHAINLVYETRPDPWQGHVAGSVLSRTRRLVAIRTVLDTAADGSGGTLVRERRIAYTTNPVNGRSLVQNVSDCDGAGNCLTPTRFSWTSRDAAANTLNAAGSGNWGGPVPVFLSTATYGSKNEQVTSQVLAGDLDGDGATDLLRSDGSGTWKACLARASAFACQDWAGPAVDSRNVLSGDFNGDHRLDIAVPPATGSAAPWTVCLSTGSGFACSSWTGRTGVGGVNRYLVGDFTGDGRDDILSVDRFNQYGGSSLCKSVGNGFEGGTCAGYNANTFIGDTMTDAETGPRIMNREVGDFDGDGRADLFLRIQDGQLREWHVHTARDSGLSLNLLVAGGYVPAAAGASHTTDHNGDPYNSYSDLIGVANAAADSAQVCRSTGTALACSPVAGSSSTNSTIVHVGDADGDGRPDLYTSGVETQICQLGSAPPYQAGAVYGSVVNGQSVNYTCSTWTTQTPIPSLSAIRGDFNKDGRLDRAWYIEETASWTVQLGGHGGWPDLLAGVTDGNGQEVQFSYGGLDNAAVYTRGAEAAYPQANLMQGAPVVAQMRVANGQGGWLNTGYKYEGLREDLRGRGALGFAKVTVIDQVNGLTRETRYSQDFPTIGMVLGSTVTQANGSVLDSSSQTLAVLNTAGGAQYPYVSASSSTRRDLDNTLVSTQTSQVDAGGIDAYGNITSASESVSAGGESYATSTVNSYDNLTGDWLIGLQRTSRITKSAPNTASVARNASVDYDTWGQVLRQTVEPDDVALRLVTEFGREPSYGVVTTRTLKWRDPASNTDQLRTVETLGYDPRYRYATLSTNARNQSQTKEYDPASGAVTKVIDINRLSTNWQYDGWGRKTREDRADATATTWAYRRCVDSCLNGAASVAITQNWAGANQATVPTEQFSDPLGRQVLTRSWGFDGTAILTERVYDASGRLDHVSRPRYTGASPVWTTLGHDAIGRVTQVLSPNATGSGTDSSRIDYHGLAVTRKNAKNQTRTEVSNGLGKLGSVTDANSQTTTYRYDPWGNLARTTDPKGNQINVGYDRLGRKSALADPDLGNWSYRVDPLGQTWQQTDAKSQVTGYTFDELGRLTRRLEPDQDSRWEYDSAAVGVGQLAEAYTVNGSGAKDYRRIHGYDSMGRPTSVLTRLDADYLETRSYDSFGRLGSVSHQRNAVGGSGGPQNRFTYSYNSQGYLYLMGRGEDSGSGASAGIWQALAQDAEGRLTREQRGNGVQTQRSYNTWTGRLTGLAGGPGDGAGGVNPSHQNDVYSYDVLGNLGYRAQINGVGSLLQENFSYDTLNRLSSSEVIGLGVRGYGYDEIGNLMSKDGVGGYTYPASGASSVRPHAVSSITGTVAGLVNPGFSYEANGNLSNGLGRSYGWTSFNMPVYVDRLSGGSAVERTGFAYGAEHQRAKQTVSPISGSTVGAATRTIWYAGAMEKEVDTTAGTTTLRTRLPSGLGYVQEVMVGTAVAATASAARSVRYHLDDHLGSPIAITDDAGAVLQRLSYDAWGRRRNLDGTDDAGAGFGSLKNSQDHDGYTGHETLDQLGLVHMNARLYDPITGRMLSADPTVPDVTNVQALNRYSYVLGNPLAYTDPSGLDPVPQLPTVVIYGDRTTAEAIASVNRAFGRGSIQAQTGVGPRLGPPGPWIALGAAPGTPAQQSFARLINKIAAEVESLAYGAKVMGTLIWASVAGDQETTEDAGDALGKGGTTAPTSDADCGGCPNPNGRKGSQAHQDEVAEAEKELEEKYKDDPNVRIRTEVKVDTPKGEKGARYIDVAAVDKETGKVIEGVQVGRQTQGGIPVARERRAINDINTAAPEAEITFRPYK